MLVSSHTAKDDDFSWAWAAEQSRRDVMLKAESCARCRSRNGLAALTGAEGDALGPECCPNPYVIAGPYSVV